MKDSSPFPDQPVLKPGSISTRNAQLKSEGHDASHWGFSMVRTMLACRKNGNRTTNYQMAWGEVTFECHLIPAPALGRDSFH